MRRYSILVMALTLSASMFAGGIITNTNQSAEFVRLQSRDATLGIDATYFNPAGLTLLPNDGFYLSLNHQTLGQTRVIKNDFPLLKDAPSSEYIGKINAPIFPGVYAAYKTGKLAFSFGFNPIGGGGGALYEDGLPEFEIPVSGLVPQLQGSLAPLDSAISQVPGMTDPGFRNITGYEMDVNFEGTSVYFGYQANVSYQINDMISVALGGRFVSAKNTYNGYLRDVMIQAPAAYGGTQTAGSYMRTVSGAISSVDPVTAGVLTGQAAVLDLLTGDMEVDVEQKGTGFTPIVSVNVKASEKLNLAFKYEHHTKIELKTTVADGKDGGGMFVDGEKVRADMPGQIVLGAMYNATDKLMLTGGFHMYLDTQADYGKTGADGEGNTVKLKNSDILDNLLEFGIGAEYWFGEKIAGSLGYLKTISEAKGYNSALGFSLSSNNIGGGIVYKINPKIDLNIAGQYTMYTEGKKDFTDPMPYVEKYDKDVWIVSLGLNFNFGAPKE